MNIRKISITFVATTALLGCATQVAVNPADTTSTQEANSFATKPGMAKIYFVGGKTGSGISIKVDMAGGAQFIVDGNQVGQIDKNDVLVMDVLPKTYSFSWQYPSGDSKMQFLSRRVNAGDVVILQANWNTGGAGFGLIGAAVAPAGYQITEISDRSVVMSKRVVKPTSCPSAICPR